MLEVHLQGQEFFLSVLLTAIAPAAKLNAQHMEGS